MAYPDTDTHQHFTGQDAVIVDVPVGTPDFAWPTAPHPALPHDHQLSSDYDDPSSSLHFTDRLPTPPPQSQPVLPVSDLPRFPRTRPVPLHAQLGHLQNPYRPASSSARIHKLPPFQLELCDLSVEVADLVQVLLQTLLQVSPPQILDSVKEQISACSLSVPLPSISAMLTALKNLNFISANASSFCNHHQKSIHAEAHDPVTPPPTLNDFDLGELLQSVGDAVSGIAAEAGVDFVLYHGDRRHVRVRGNEGGILYLLTHVVYQILSTSREGDSIEMGLFVRGTSAPNGFASPPSDTRNDQDGPNHFTASDGVVGGRLQCTLRISHSFADLPNGIGRKDSQSSSCDEPRPHPSLSSNLLHRLLHQIGATLTPDLPSSKPSTAGRTWEIVMPLDSGSSSVAGTPVTSSIDTHKDRPPVEEPTVDQLFSFIDTLKGRRVTFYTKPDSAFSRHMTSYMSSWGMEIAHVSPTDDPEAEPPPVPLSTGEAQVRYLQSTGSNISTRGDPKPSETTPISPTIILIDDNMTILQERIHRVDHSSSELRKRPSLASYHRPRSFPPRAASQPATEPLPPSIILYFTSLSNYKAVKDIVQYLGLTSKGPMPEVMIIPKPVGPRRLLTALHTAATKPLVDPLFTPTATLPFSPMPMPTVTAQDETPPASKTPNPKSHRPTNSRSTSDHSVRTMNMEGVNIPTPSPRGSEHVDFLSDAAVQLGTTIKSGLLIHSPDAAGVFFHPRGKPQRNLSSLLMERDRGQNGEERPLTTAARLPHVGDGEVAVFEASKSKSAPPGAKPAVTALVKKVATPRSDIPVMKPPPVTQRKTILQDNPSIPVKPPSLVHTSAVVPVPKPPSPPAKPEKKGFRKLNMIKGKDSLDLGGKKGNKKDDNKIVPPINVLIVDDNPINQTLLSTFMTRKRIRFDQARNGQEAVEKWRTGEFHLILMDIQMPIMNGIEATQEIRRLEDVNAGAGYLANSPFMEELQQQTPVHTPSDTSDSDSKGVSTPHRSAVIIVALTASTLEKDRLAALSAGCNDYLTKPVSLHWLNNKIVEWGSIKALQMWSDPRSDVLRGLSAAQAKNVADRLHLQVRRSSAGSRADAASAAATNGSATSESSAANNPTNQISTAVIRGRRASSGSAVTMPSDFTYRLLQISTASQSHPIISTAQAIAGLMTPSDTPADDKLFTQMNGMDAFASEFKTGSLDEEHEVVLVPKEPERERETDSPTTPTPISARRTAAAVVSVVSEQILTSTAGLLSPPPDVPESTWASVPASIDSRLEIQIISPEPGSPRESNPGTGDVPLSMGNSRSHAPGDSSTGAQQRSHQPNEANGSIVHASGSSSSGGDDPSGQDRWRRGQGH
ncbi:hypothetical protein BDN72DRAFT_833269 [Pluteus cervinus]|uniref:Uncharacterized protein n=1 Tax=Pluteus cervinus TaxID=181527 RepID=A0ACD3B9I3_9AGAR|nr:hypothetical protein BDN72DRAFT_833269 [Pluteus cervinus]